MFSGGSVSNAASGSISGYDGIFLRGAAGTVANDGRVTGISSNGDGVRLYSGGSITNSTSASIIGNVSGVRLIAGGTLTNAGTIVGNHGTAVAFSSTNAGMLVVDPGATFSGLVIGSPSANITLDLAAGIGIGTLSGLGSSFTNFGSVMVASGGTWDFTGSSTIAAGVGLTDDGTLVGTLTNESFVDGPLTFGNGGVLTNGVMGSIANGGTAAIYSDGGTVTVVNDGSIAGTGSLTTLSDALDLNPDASVTNASTASITGVLTGVYIAGTGTVVNDGSIAGTRKYGVNLGSGSSVTNAAGATITGGTAGIFTEGASPSTVVNNGSIAGTSASSSGVALGSGGSVTNAATASITGYHGVSSNGAGTVVNAGSIAGTSGNGDGVTLHFGGSVSNSITASITGYHGIDVSGHAGTVDNDGSVIGTGNYGYAIDLSAGGSVTNAASASITGGTGIEISGSSAGTVINNGRIAGTHGDGVNLESGSVTNASSASISGKYHGVSISGAGTVVNDGSIAATASNGVGVYLRSAGSLTNAASASITGHLGVDLYAGGTLTNAGMIIGNNGTAAAFSGTDSNLLVLDPGYGFSGLVTGSASASNTLELASAVSAGTISGLGTDFVNFGPIEFDVGAEWSISGDTSGLAGTISGFAAGDTIELTDVTATGSSFVGSILTLDETGGGTATLDLPGTFTLASFVVTPGVSSGTEVTLVAPCFCAGTRIACLDGERTVETLVPGAFVRVAGAEYAEITWIGHRRVDCTPHPKPEDVWPVRVRANSFANRIPHRDLLLSPDHAVFIDGVLIPIRYLINGRTIVQERVDNVTYYHVELPSHDVILAEGLPCESYLDTGNRGAFANGGTSIQMHPDFALKVWETQACAELVVNGPNLEAAKSVVLAQADALGYRMTNDPDLSVVVDGHTLPPKITGKTWRVSLSPDVQSVRLVSRRWVPAHILTDNNDTRSLGVAIANVCLDGRTLPPDDPRLCSGWHAAERQWRWTDGDAGLVVVSVRELAFEVAITGRYWEAPGELDKASVRTRMRM
jgi:hypothetical protein